MRASRLRSQRICTWSVRARACRENNGDTDDMRMSANILVQVLHVVKTPERRTGPKAVSRDPCARQWDNRSISSWEAALGAVNTYT